jgi:3-oxoadipate enol-lactonase
VIEVTQVQRPLAATHAAERLEQFAPDLPPGRTVQIGRRGTAFVRELPGPPGAVDAPTFVLLHGWTATSDLNWFTTIDALGEHHRVVAFDHRGHGRGIRNPARFRLADCADDVIALADELGIEQVVPVGYSMGCPVAQLVAHRHPDRTAGLVLCATSRNFAGSPRGRMFTHAMHGASQLIRIAPPPLRLRLTDRIVSARVDDSPIREWADRELRQNDVRMLAEAGAALGRFTSHEWISTVDVPAAVVVTAADRIVPPHRQRRLAEALPHATVHVVQGGEHSACVLQPDAFRTALLEATTSVASRIEPTGA